MGGETDAAPNSAASWVTQQGGQRGQAPRKSDRENGSRVMWGAPSPTTSRRGAADSPPPRLVVRHDSWRREASACRSGKVVARALLPASRSLKARNDKRAERPTGPAKRYPQAIVGEGPGPSPIPAVIIDLTTCSSHDECEEVDGETQEDKGVRRRSKSPPASPPHHQPPQAVGGTNLPLATASLPQKKPCEELPRL